jgi:hypothetical protein
MQVHAACDPHHVEMDESGLVCWGRSGHEEAAMKGLVTALGILCFASAMAYAKTGKFHVPSAVANPLAPYAQWHRPHSSRDHGYTSLTASVDS